ncbi:MAG: tRNA 2-thiouridine(34) synthase MnmA [Bacillota bacterium]
MQGVASMRVAVAMSGGVDSSVAAALLKGAGHEVIGITMEIWPPGRENGGCCGLAAVQDARRVAFRLGIPHYVVNLREVFARQVIDNFCAEYARGRTPNPCIRCNRYVKFDALLERARALEAAFLATGHYARIARDRATGRFLLKKGVDQGKDQSYFLYSLTQAQLSRILFPLGELTKERVRAVARDLGLPVAEKAESQEVCFIPDNDYHRFLRRHCPGDFREGPILDERGRVLGRHRGLAFYTVGQRRGLGIAAGEPLYVVALDPVRNAVVVGPERALYREALVAGELNWIAFDALQAPLQVQARIRYRHREAPATVAPRDEGRVLVRFFTPQRAITPGQAAVFYDGDLVVGGGTILFALDGSGEKESISTGAN